MSLTKFAVKVELIFEQLKLRLEKLDTIPKVIICSESAYPKYLGSDNTQGGQLGHVFMMHPPRGQPKPATKSIPRVELSFKCFKHIFNSSWAAFPVDGAICISAKLNYLPLCTRNSFVASSQFRPLISEICI